MKIRGHKIGILVTITVVAVFTKEFIYYIPGIVLGNILPDLDADHSYIKSKLKTIGKLYSKLPKCRLFGQEGYNHRSLLLHSVYTLIGLMLLSYYFNSRVILGLFFGVLTHHILDFPIRRYFKW